MVQLLMDNYLEIQFNDRNQVDDKKVGGGFLSLHQIFV